MNLGGLQADLKGCQIAIRRPAKLRQRTRGAERGRPSRQTLLVLGTEDYRPKSGDECLVEVKELDRTCLS